jgi:hypothetical protein
VVADRGFEHLSFHVREGPEGFLEGFRVDSSISRRRSLDLKEAEISLLNEVND